MIPVSCKHLHLVRKSDTRFVLSWFSVIILCVASFQTSISQSLDVYLGRAREYDYNSNGWIAPEHDYNSNSWQQERKKIASFVQGREGDLVVLTNAGIAYWTKVADSVQVAQVIDSNVGTLVFDNQQRLVLSYQNGEVKGYDYRSKAFTFISRSENGVNRLFYDINDRLFAVTFNGVEDMQTHQMYLTMKGAAKYFKIPYAAWDKKPSVIYQANDSARSVWIGFDGGDLGGLIYVFSCRDTCFSSEAMKLCSYSPVRSIFSLNGSVYSFHGQADMNRIQSEIFKQPLSQCKPVFKYDYRIPKANALNVVEIMKKDLSFLSVCYSVYDSCVYISTMSGLYRIKDAADMRDYNKWEKLVVPIVPNYSGPWTYDSTISIQQMLPVGPKKILLLGEDGIIYQYNDKAIRKVFKIE